MKRFGPRALAEMLSAWQGRVDSWLAVFSAIALVLVVSNELVQPDFVFPWIDLSWTTLQVGLRTTIWLAYVAVFATYTTLGAKRLTYVREHALQLIVCLTWLPFHSEAVLSGLTLNRLLPIDVLQVVGSLCHGWIVVRWTARNFNGHPIFVIGLTTIVLIASAAGLLHAVEPQTYKTFWDAAWFSLVTITTIGYGDLVPHTTIGRAIAAVLMLSGISLLGLFLATAGVFMRKRLLKEDEDEVSNKVLLGELKRIGSLLEQVLREQEAAKRKSAELEKGGANALAEGAGNEPAEGEGTAPVQPGRVSDGIAKSASPGHEPGDDENQPGAT